VSIIERLKAMVPVQVGDFSDIDTVDELEEEWPADDGEDASDSAPEDEINAAKLKAEIEELEGYLALARSIPRTPKAANLCASCLPCWIGSRPS